jgi:hypothetical protein
VSFIQLTLEDGRSVLIRADLIQQIRQHENGTLKPGGCEIWLPTATIVVSETIEQVKEIVGAGANVPAPACEKS